MRRRSLHYGIIRVLFWAFPYLLWQAFGHWSGFLVGVIVAVMLTAMFNSLFRVGGWNTASSAGRRSFQTAEPQPRGQEVESYQRGYLAEAELYRASPHPYQVGELQFQYEEMQIPYPEMPLMEQE